MTSDLSEIDDEDMIEVTDPVPSASMASIIAAKRYPRSIKAFIDMAEALATSTQEIASACMYSVPRAGKQLTGPSVRLAEICASAWGNMDFGARIIREDATHVVVQGFAQDLERNNRCAFEIRRRITNKTGARFNDDMVTMTVNAAQSIALRNAIFRVVPKALVDEIFNRARVVAVGEQKTLGARRTALVDYFKKLGVTVEKLLATVDKPSVEDMDGEDLLTLRGLANAIKDGSVQLENAFPEYEKVSAKNRVSAIKGGSTVVNGKTPEAKPGEMFPQETGSVDALKN